MLLTAYRTYRVLMAYIQDTNGSHGIPTHGTYGVHTGNTRYSQHVYKTNKVLTAYI